MNGLGLGLEWYRFRATFRRRWGGSLSLALLLALIGGIAMGSIAAGRRTQSSYPRFLASTNPSDVTITESGSGNVPYSPSLVKAIARIPGVTNVRTLISPFIVPSAPNGAPIGVLTNTPTPGVLGSVDGLDFTQDKVTVVQGRNANLGRPDEFVATADTARVLGAHVGQVIPVGAYTYAQVTTPAFGTPRVAPYLRIDAKLVGIVVVNTQLIQDDVDRFPSTTGYVLFTPALSRQLLTDSNATLYGLQLDRGSRDVAAVVQQVYGLLPLGARRGFEVRAPFVTKVERAVKPEAIALGVFGAIAAVAALTITAQAISRQIQADDHDRQILRALGAGPAQIVADGLIGILGSIVIGALLAGLVAIVISPLSPVGPVRPVYPSEGVAFDWTVLLIGTSVLIAVPAATAVALSVWRAPQRLARRAAAAARQSSVARLASSSGLPPSGVVGVRFALEPGRGHSSVPVRSALFGAVLALVMVVATVTFGSSLRTLVTRPALYGWNWTYALNSNSSAVPPASLIALTHDPDVAAWSGIISGDPLIDGQSVAAIVEDIGAQPSPPMLSGHPVSADDQIVLGPATLAQVHKHVGDTVTLTGGSPSGPSHIPPTALTVVGTATMPVLGNPALFSAHPSMGSGALLPTGALPAAFRNAQLDPDPNNNGPSWVFVRLRRGISPAAGRADLQRVADAGSRALDADPNSNGSAVTVISAQRPAEIVNYQTMGATPVILASGLAAGALVALGLTLVSSVRGRRRDLALLKALGFTPRQLAASVAWQATIAAAIGTVVGVPLGIALGRQLWTVFAHNIYAVPEPTVPVLSVVVIIISAFLFANLVASLPGRVAARTPTALVLRSE